MPVIALLAMFPGWQQDENKNFSAEQAARMVRDIASPGAAPASAETTQAIRKQVDDAAAVFASHPPVWPVFGYLWWLGVLIFDLAVVWHRYGRSEVALDNLRKQRGCPNNSLVRIAREAARKDGVWPFRKRHTGRRINTIVLDWDGAACVRSHGDSPQSDIPELDGRAPVGIR
jgi:hypothetical protein